MFSLVLSFIMGVAFARPPAQSPARWRFVEEWRVGGDADGARAFDDVRDLDVFADGRLAVVDGKTQRLHIPSARGAAIRSVGQRGSGPGEYQYVNGAAIAPNDQIVVHDPRNSRLTILASSGDFVRTVPIPPRGISGRWSGYFDAMGRLVESVTIPATERRIGGTHNAPLVTAQASVQVWNDALTKADTTPLVDCQTFSYSTTDRYFVFETATGPALRPIPFIPATTSIAGRDGHVWSLRTEGHLVRRRRGTCDVSGEIALDWSRVDVPVAVRRAHEDSVRRTAASVQVRDPSLERIPRQYPRFHTLRVDAANRLWVERDASPTAREFRVYQQNGRLLATIAATSRFAEGLPVVITADHLFGFMTDEDGVAYLVSLRIVQA